MTTPNRWFPVEFHTTLPRLHWLPALATLGMEFFAAEENLNLLSRRTLADTARAAGIRRFRIASASLLGLRTNLVLFGQKPTP